MRKFQVAYIGLNCLYGKLTSLLLKQSPHIGCLKLYDDGNIGPAIDVSEINSNCRVKSFLGEDQLNKALIDVDVVVIGDEVNEFETNYDRIFLEAANKFGRYAHAISKVANEAIIILGASPLNSLFPLLSNLLHDSGVHNNDKVLGSTALDNIYSSYIMAHYLGMDPKHVVLPVIGGFSGNSRVPLLSQVKPNCKLSLDVVDSFIEKLRNRERHVFNSNGTREVISKAYANVKFLNSVFAGLRGEPNVTEIVMSKTNLVNGVEYFSLPVILGHKGISKRFDLPKLSRSEEKMISKAVVNINKDVDRAMSYLNGTYSGVSDNLTLENERTFSKIRSSVQERGKRSQINEEAESVDSTFFFVGNNSAIDSLVMNFCKPSEHGNSEYQLKNSSARNSEKFKYLYNKSSSKEKVFGTKVDVKPENKSLKQLIRLKFDKKKTLQPLKYPCSDGANMSKSDRRGRINTLHSSYLDSFRETKPVEGSLKESSEILKNNIEKRELGESWPMLYSLEHSNILLDVRKSEQSLSSDLFDDSEPRMKNYAVEGEVAKLLEMDNGQFKEKSSVLYKWDKERVNEKTDGLENRILQKIRVEVDKSEILKNGNTAARLNRKKKLILGQRVKLLKEITPKTANKTPSILKNLNIFKKEGSTCNFLPIGDYYIYDARLKRKQFKSLEKFNVNKGKTAVQSVPPNNANLLNFIGSSFNINSVDELETSDSGKMLCGLVKVSPKNTSKLDIMSQVKSLKRPPVVKNKFHLLSANKPSRKVFIGFRKDKLQDNKAGMKTEADESMSSHKGDPSFSSLRDKSYSDDLPKKALVGAEFMPPPLTPKKSSITEISSSIPCSESRSKVKNNIKTNANFVKTSLNRKTLTIKRKTLFSKLSTLNYYRKKTEVYNGDLIINEAPKNLNQKKSSLEKEVETSKEVSKVGTKIQYKGSNKAVKLEPSTESTSPVTPLTNDHFINDTLIQNWPKKLHFRDRKANIKYFLKTQRVVNSDFNKQKCIESCYPKSLYKYVFDNSPQNEYNKFNNFPSIRHIRS